MVTYIINMIANQDALHLHKIRVYRVKPIDLGINKKTWCHVIPRIMEIYN